MPRSFTTTKEVRGARMTIRRLVWALLMMLAAGRVAVAQDVITISGVVTTRADGLPVPGALVSVVGASASATGDASGRYVLTVPRALVRADRIQLKIDALGLPAQLVEVVVNAPTLTVDVALSLAF